MTLAAFRETERTFRADERTFAQYVSEAGSRLATVGRRDNPRYLALLAEAAELVTGVMDGRIPSYRLQEALTTSDFPLLMGDILDRQLLGRYAEWPVAWPTYARRGTVRDFRQARRIAVDGLEGSYYPAYLKPEMVPGTRDEALTETGYLTQVEVYEKVIGINWRMLINDDLDAFQSIPERLARGARRTEDRFATTLHVDASGPHASLYTVGNANIINTTNGAATNNPALSIQGLQDGFAVLGRMVDSGGDPIMVEAVELVVPPSLEIIARNILNATELILGGLGEIGGGGVAAQQLRVQNWMRNKVRLTVNPYIPIIATTNGNTSWFLFASTSSGRPALEVTFLRGYENPGLYMKAPNTVRIGGSAVSELGDFDTGEITYKGMHVIGGTRLEPKATVASNGSGS